MGAFDPPPWGVRVFVVTQKSKERKQTTTNIVLREEKKSKSKQLSSTGSPLTGTPPDSNSQLKHHVSPESFQVLLANCLLSPDT
jgi:hypothetical protein